MDFRELGQGLIQDIGGVVEQKIDKSEEKLDVCPMRDQKLFSIDIFCLLTCSLALVVAGK